MNTYEVLVAHSEKQIPVRAKDGEEAVPKTKTGVKSWPVKPDCPASILPRVGFGVGF